MESIISDSYAVHFNEKAFKALNLQLKEKNYSTIFILLDENTHELCLPNFMAEIHGDYSFEIIEIESGEIHKNIETCVGVWEALSVHAWVSSVKKRSTVVVCFVFVPTSAVID
jgi:3-dehydroquinate synthase